MQYEMQKIDGRRIIAYRDLPEHTAERPDEIESRLGAFVLAISLSKEDQSAKVVFAGMGTDGRS